MGATALYIIGLSRNVTWAVGNWGLGRDRVFSFTRGLRRCVGLVRRLFCDSGFKLKEKAMSSALITVVLVLVATVIYVFLVERSHYAGSIFGACAVLCVVGAVMGILLITDQPPANDKAGLILALCSLGLLLGTGIAVKLLFRGQPRRRRNNQ